MNDFRTNELRLSCQPDRRRPWPRRGWRILPAALLWTTAVAARDPSAALLVPDAQERPISTKAGFHSVEVRGKDGAF